MINENGNNKCNKKYEEEAKIISTVVNIPTLFRYESENKCFQLFYLQVETHKAENSFNSIIAPGHLFVRSLYRDDIDV